MKNVVSSRMIEQDKDSEWYMAGTEKTGEYIVVFKSDLGRVGFRLTGGFARVRVEPGTPDHHEKLQEFFPENNGWRQPELLGQYRFSQVFFTPEKAIEAVEYAIKALGVDGTVRRGGITRFWRMAIRAYFPSQASIAA
jgi:hypothetical protein